MGVLNRIVLIFILLAAAGAAVLSYFLFEKRTQMLQGWDQMAKQIAETAAALDNGSGTQIADSFKDDALHHRNSLADMNTKLQALSEGAKKVIQQRDELAGTIRDLAAAVEVTTVDTKQLASVEQYQAHKGQVLSSVRAIQERNQGILRNFISAGQTLQVSGTESGIKSDRGNAFLGQIRTAVNKKNARITNYETNLRKIGGVVGKGFQNAENSYSSSTAGVATGVSVQRDTLNATKRELTTAKGKITSLENTKKSLEDTIKDKDRTIFARDGLIKDLRAKLNPTGDADIDRLLYGKRDKAYFRDLYTLVKGSVQKVDRKWNFVVIDIGSKTKVHQTLAGKTFSSILDIPTKKTMSVVRGLDTEKPELVCKILITEIHSDYAVANIDEASVKEKVEAGDAVVFLDDDLDALLKDFKAPDLVE